MRPARLDAALGASRAAQPAQPVAHLGATLLRAKEDDGNGDQVRGAAEERGVAPGEVDVGEVVRVKVDGGGEVVKVFKVGELGDDVELLATGAGRVRGVVGDRAGFARERDGATPPAASGSS